MQKFFSLDKTVSQNIRATFIIRQLELKNVPALVIYRAAAFAAIRAEQSPCRQKIRRSNCAQNFAGKILTAPVFPIFAQAETVYRESRRQQLKNSQRDAAGIHVLENLANRLGGRFPLH